MDLLQYCFTLDASHPMQAVRERVASKRHLLDTLPGLRWKAWMLSEPLPGRSQPKTYAPLYLFDDTPAALAFLRGDIYRGVTDAFGWTLPLHGPAVGGASLAPGAALSCALHTTQLHDHAALRATAEAVEPPADALLVARQVDVSRMLLRSYTFRSCPAAEVRDTRADMVYEVVAVSRPAPARAWP
jgi:hypothetical protein